MTTRRWVDWVNVILGLWLMTSPWLLTFAAGDGGAAWNSWSVGVAIVTLAGFAMYKPAIWGEVVGIRVRHVVDSFAVDARPSRVRHLRPQT